MNINIYLEDSLTKSLTRHAKKSKRSRNDLIREAIKEWPESILNFNGIDDATPFESDR